MHACLPRPRRTRVAAGRNPRRARRIGPRSSRSAHGARARWHRHRPWRADAETPTPPPDRRPRPAQSPVRPAEPSIERVVYRLFSRTTYRAVVACSSTLPHVRWSRFRFVGLSMHAHCGAQCKAALVVAHNYISDRLIESLVPAATDVCANDVSPSCCCNYIGCSVAPASGGEVYRSDMCIGWLASRPSCGQRLKGITPYIYPGLV